MSLTRKVGHNTIIQFGSKIISIIIGIATIAIMARYLGASGFGQYTTVTAYLQLFAILIDFGLALTIISLISAEPEKEGEIVNNVLTFRLISALIFLGLAPLVSLLFPYPAIVKIGIAITATAFIFNALNQILTSIFQKNLRTDLNGLSEILGRIALLVCVGLAAYLNWGILGILAAQIFSSLVIMVLNFAFAKKWISFKLAFNWPVWKKIWRVTWPIAITITFNLIYYKADTIILSVVRPESEVGIYGATYRVLEIITQFPFLFVGLVFPILAAAYQSKEMEKYRRILQKSFDFLVIVALPLAFGTLFVAQDLMTFVAGEEFSNAGPVLKIIMFAVVMIFLNSIFGYNIVVIGQQKKMIGAYLFVAIIAVTGYLIFIPRYSYFGAAYMTVVAESLMLLFNLIVNYFTIHYLPNLITLGKSLLACLIMSVALYLIGAQNLFIMLGCGALVYAAALYLLKGISKQMIKEILWPKIS